MTRTRVFFFFSPLVAAAGLLAIAETPLAAQPRQRADSAALVTVLGRDTLALERWVRTGDRVSAEVVVRAPRTTLRRYEMELEADGRMRRFEERVFDPASPGRARRTERVEAAGERWVRTVVDSAGAARSDTVAGPRAALPFVDLVHWPYEVALVRATASGARGTEAEMPLLAGGRVVPFRVRWPGAGAVELVHPLRGTMTAEVDAAGRLLWLDAARTTRKVRVSRVGWMPLLEETARRWAASDAAGRGVGELSGRGQVETTVAGARITVDYGTPSKRGREIWGAIVPWGQVWRTGANRATHFSTDRALVLGDPRLGPVLEVPAGEYTLFSVPAPDGGVLIVSRQTGQNGTAYDAARDLGRVRMRTGKLAEEVERFTIGVEEAGSGRGAITLAWDRAQLAVPFEVKE